MAADIFMSAVILCGVILAVSSRPSTSAPPTYSCHHLRRRILQCLGPYERLLVTYRARDTTAAERHRMVPAFCHEYEKTLQCLHDSFLTCSPGREHLNLVERRLGVWRQFMDETCRPAPPPTRPPPTTTTTPSTTTFPFWLRRTTPPTYTSRNGKHYHYQYPGVTDKPHIMFIEVNSHKNSIPMDLAEPLYDQDSSDTQSELVHIKAPEDCTEEEIQTNQICAMFQRSSAATSKLHLLCSIIALLGLIIAHNH